MVSGRSSSVALAALLASGGGAGLFAPGVHAGQPIEFSAPAIPLSVPKLEMEVKEPERINAPPGMGTGYMPGVEIPPPMTIVIRPSKTKAKDGWEARASDIEGRKDPFDDVWQSTSPDSDSLTNELSAQQGWNSGPDERLNQGKGGFVLDKTQDTRRIGAQDESKRKGGRGESDLGRAFSDESDSSSDNSSDRSFWSKAFDRHDPSVLGRLMDGGFNPYAGDTSIGAGGISGPATSIFNKGAAASPLASSLVPSDYGSSSFADDPLRRQAGDSAGAPQDQMRAWGNPPAFRQIYRSSSSRELPSPARAAAPSRPVNLQWPKKPGDPF
jgi:hypothetical protein